MSNPNNIIEQDYKVEVKTREGCIFSVYQKAPDMETARILVNFKYHEVGCKSYYAESN